MSEVRKTCRWCLRYASAWWCRREAFVNPETPMRKLDLGCDCNPEEHFQEQPWKSALYGDPDEQGDTPRVLEWDESEDTT